MLVKQAHLIGMKLLYMSLMLYESNRVKWNSGFPLCTVTQVRCDVAAHYPNYLMVGRVITINNTTMDSILETKKQHVSVYHWPSSCFILEVMLQEGYTIIANLQLLQ
jgi:hypothetical protein